MGVSSLSDSSIVTGDFEGTATFGSTTLWQYWRKGFLVTDSADGSYAWAKSAGGSSDEQGYYVSSLGVAAPLLLAFSAARRTLATTLTSAGSHDVFIAAQC